MSLPPSEKTEARKNRYKVSVDVEEGRRKREVYLVEIRKQKREECFMKKRRDSFQDFPHPSAAGYPEKKLEILTMIDEVRSDDPSLQLKSTTQFRKMLSTEISPNLIDDLIQSGVVPRFVEFLKKKDNSLLQFEAAWVLTSIASVSSEHTKFVMDHDAIQALCALGNVAGYSIECRDFVHSCGALMPQMNKQATLLILRKATWTLAKFFSHKPLPLFHQMKSALPVLKRLVHSNDIQVVANACWSLSYLCASSIGNIQSVIETGVVARLVEVLQHPSLALVPALRTIGNIVFTGDRQQTQSVISSGALPVLANLLNHNYEKIIKKEACWTISNITVGIKEQIQAVIDANLIPTLVNLAQNAEFDIKKEALWAISNVASCGSHDQIKCLVEQSCIKPLCDILVCSDLKIISVCLDGLENILKVGEAEKKNTGDMNYYSQLIEDAEGLEKIENLQYHENQKISERAVKILDIQA